MNALRFTATLCGQQYAQVTPSSPPEIDDSWSEISCPFLRGIFHDFYADPRTLDNDIWEESDPF